MGAGDSILALICGYSASVRNRLKMPMFVAHCDESGKGGPLFVVGGLTAKAEAWLPFSEEWQSVLDTVPSIPAFHLADRQGLSHAEHERKIDRFIEIINAHVDRGDLAIMYDQIYRTLYPKIFSATIDQPYHFTYVHIFQQCALHLPDPSGKIDFIFDWMDDTQYLELLRAFRQFREVCPSEDVKCRFNQEPFRSHDDKVLPLQAADLWAGLMRRAVVDLNADAKQRLKTITIPNRAFVWDEESLRCHWRRQIAQTPTLLTGKYYENKKQRGKRLGPSKRNLPRE